MMKDLAIYGMGGFGREVACLINYINEQEPTWNLIGFFDDGKQKGDKCEYGQCLGGLSELNNWENPLCVAIAIAKPSNLKHVATSITNQNVTFPNIIPHDAFIFDKETLYMGKGNIVQRQCEFSCNVRVGDFNAFNFRTVVGHDTTIGNYNSVMTDAGIMGNVSIGDLNYFGTHSVVLQGLKVGNEVTVAAGSVIMRRPKDGYTYMGSPANPWLMTKK